jgi:[ribosomal protein S18]-alanine N-acetyltransferase
VTIRPATGDDVACVLALELALFGEDAWSEQTVLATLARGRVLVAEDGDVLLGYVVLADADDVADLERIGVRRDHQRAGLASALLDAALRDHERDRVLLEVRADNRPALAFYTRAGFAEIHRRRRYYRDGTDAIVLELDLRHRPRQAVEP